MQELSEAKRKVDNRDYIAEMTTLSGVILALLLVVVAEIIGNRSLMVSSLGVVGFFGTISILITLSTLKHHKTITRLVQY